MVTLLWAAKGGSGTTVVASLLALEPTRPQLLIDLAGEVPAVLGLPESDRVGVADWLRSEGTTSQLVDLVVDADDTTAVLPWTTPTTTELATRWVPPSDPGIAPERWSALASWARHWALRHDGQVIIDAGTGPPPMALADAVDDRVLVTRSCYLSLRRAQRAPVRPSGVVLIEEPGRALKRKDVEHSTAAPLLAVLPLDPAIARLSDCGLLAAQIPRSVRTIIRRLASRLTAVSPDTSVAA